MSRAMFALWLLTFLFLAVVLVMANLMVLSYWRFAFSDGPLADVFLVSAVVASAMIWPLSVLFIVMWTRILRELFARPGRDALAKESGEARE